MSWKAVKIKEEKIKFIADYLKREYYFNDLCNRYGISRKTGYKLINRFNTEGESAIEERSHCRHTHPNLTDFTIQEKLIALKHRYPKWGPLKLRQWLEINKAGQWPAASTIGEVLKRHGLVMPRKYRKKVAAHSEPLMHCHGPNQVWSADFKGQFRLGNARYCYPLTISDNHSRFLLACDGFESPNLTNTQKSFERAFKEYGLPHAIRTDNGQPFAGLGIGGLTRLSIWWLKLGIVPERIDLGAPQQNGRHERMHKTLKEAVSVKKDFKKQQLCFEEFRQEYNRERPHEALKGQRPADVYVPSSRILLKLQPEVVYPHFFEIRKVKTNGEIRWFGKRYYLSELLVGEPVGCEMIDEGRATIYFAKFKLGIIDARGDKIIRL